MSSRCGAVSSSWFITSTRDSNCSGVRFRLRALRLLSWHVSSCVIFDAVGRSCFAGEYERPHMCAYVCMYVCVCMCVRVYVLSVHLGVCMCVRAHHIHVCVCVYMCVCVCVFVCLCVCVLCVVLCTVCVPMHQLQVHLQVYLLLTSTHRMPADGSEKGTRERATVCSAPALLGRSSCKARMAAKMLPSFSAFMPR
jgi:hypothetical protein